MSIFFNKEYILPIIKAVHEWRLKTARRQVIKLSTQIYFVLWHFLATFAKNIIWSMKIFFS